MRPIKCIWKNMTENSFCIAVLPKQMASERLLLPLILSVPTSIGSKLSIRKYEIHEIRTYNCQKIRQIDRISALFSQNVNKLSRTFRLIFVCYPKLVGTVGSFKKRRKLQFFSRLKMSEFYFCHKVNQKCMHCRKSILDMPHWFVSLFWLTYIMQQQSHFLVVIEWLLKKLSHSCIENMCISS